MSPVWESPRSPQIFSIFCVSSENVTLFYCYLSKIGIEDKLLEDQAMKWQLGLSILLYCFITKKKSGIVYFSYNFVVLT